jgi:hypothetical protein
VDLTGVLLPTDLAAVASATADRVLAVAVKVELARVGHLALAERAPVVSARVGAMTRKGIVACKVAVALRFRVEVAWASGWRGRT